ncbi:unnamed protein product [Adineta ricciae]|uniref:RIMS-binding protein 2 n=1 Tax=Adineta ricciae TaxID=249248 RepID=A0A815WJN3_ADIRI|nr:unnamed protein product [Adineta ricciae]
MTKRQVTIIDELWDNEQSNTNRRLYDEQERALQRQNVELNDRVRKFEKQLEVIRHDQPRDHSKELVKRALSKQTIEYNRILARKDEEIHQLHTRIKQLSKSNSLEAALRQSNIEKIHLEKRLLSSSSSLNSTTTTNASPATTFTANTSDNHHSSSLRTNSSSTSSVDPNHFQPSQTAHELFEADVHSNAVNFKSQRQQTTELQEAYRNLEMKYNQLLDIEERYKKEKLAGENYAQENERLKEKIRSLENHLSSHKLEGNQRLETELQLSIKERETMAMSNAQLHADLNNATNTNERLTDECDKLRTALGGKTDENEQLKKKISELEFVMKSLRETNDLQRRLSDENEMNKKELKRKQDDFEQFQKMHDATKREHQTTIHSLQDKIHDLERKTELQALKHEEILRQLETIKSRRDRVLPPALGNLLPIPSTTISSLPKSLDSQNSVRDDSAPIKPRRRSTIANDKSAEVVVAKYSYEPLKFSPNDHPEIELPLKSGEYYLIYGDVDEDGFYDGRNLEGRYGLIPSNFIELITNPYDLPEHTKYLIQKLTGRTFPVDDRTSRQREQTFSLDSDVFTSNTPPANLAHRKITNSSSSDISNDDQSYGKHVPCPTNLRVEKSLTNSVLIAWNPPASNTQILGYQVLLDHSLYSSVRANERTRALIENINLNEKSHRISIRTISQRGLSHDQECTLLLTNSKELAYIPHDLRVDRITQTSAVVSWWPASNDVVHKLYVNDIDVQTLKPGVYRFKLSGLSPNTLHKVTIKAKPPVPPSSQQQVSASVEFRTTSFGTTKTSAKPSKNESIEPPKRVQVIAGPQTNTILVSWEQPSTAASARGYRVLIDGRQVQDINNPLNDHTVINLNAIRDGRYLTLRTLTDNGGESHDSTSIDLDDVLKKLDMDIPSARIATISKEIVVAFQSMNDDDMPKSPLSPTSKNHRKGSRQMSTIGQEVTTPMVAPSPLKPTLSGKETNKPLVRTSLESPSVTSSISSATEISQSEIKSSSPRTSTHGHSPVRQHLSSDANRIRSPMSETVNKSDEHRLSPKMPNKSLTLQTKNHFLGKINGPPRLFIALFDYDPNAMSPNQDSEEELPFKKGQLIKIFGDQDADGFYIGQSENGRTGYVPSNMVSELESDESETDSNVSSATSTKRTPPISTLANAKSFKKMIALFDYNPADHSPNTNHSDELSFHAGDIVYVHGNIHDDGFYSGELENGKKGFVPSNYLKEMPSEDSAMKRDTEPNETKKIPATVKPEIKANVEKPSNPSAEALPAAIVPSAATKTTTAAAETVEPPKQLGFFDRLINTFSWNSNEPR